MSNFYIRKRSLILALIGLSAVAIPLALRAQQAQKPLTNSDVLNMVKKAGLSESVVVATIQSNPGNYDISPDALIALHKAGITDAEINAIVAVASGASPSGRAVPNANAPSAPPTPRFQMPVVTVIQNGASQQLPLEKTQLAQTKTRPTSMASLAGDTALAQGIQAGVSDATMAAASRMNSNVGSS